MMRSNSLLPWQTFFKFSAIALLFVLYSQITCLNWGQTLVQKSFQHKIFQIEKNIKSQNIGLLKKSSSNEPIILNNDASISQEYFSFVFKSDSIVFWTTNKIAPQIKDLKTGKTLIIPIGSTFAIIRVETFLQYKVLSGYFLKNRYTFQNEYLTNDINPELVVSNSIELGIEKAKHNIFFEDGSFGFSMIFLEKATPTTSQSYLIFILFVLSFIYFASFLMELVNALFIKSRYLNIVLFSVVLLVIRLILQEFNFPTNLYNSEFFQPNLYASSLFIPSLGDLCLSVLTLLVIVNQWNRLILSENIVQNRTFQILILLSSLVCLLFLLSISFFVTKSLVFDSNLSFDLIDISEFSSISFVGYFIIAVLFVVEIQIIRIYLFEARQLNHRIVYIASLILYFPILLASFFVFGKEFYYFQLLTFLPLLYFTFRKRNIKETDFIVLLITLISFSFAINFQFYLGNSESDLRKRQMLLRQLSVTEDPEFEYIFGEIEKKAYKDELLYNMFSLNYVSYDSIVNYFRNVYFKKDKITKKFDIQITICNETDQLIVKPDNIQVNCSRFFFDNLINYGKLTTSSKNLYRLEYGSGQINYLAMMQFIISDSSSKKPFTVFFEINSKLKRKGFTKLLSEKGSDPFEKIGINSFAKYTDYQLVESYGKHQYSTRLTIKPSNKSDFSDTVFSGFSHTLFYLNNNCFVLSKKSPTLLDVLAPFSYIVFFVLINFFIFGYLLGLKMDYSNLWLSFSSRLQVFIIMFLIISFVSIGGLSIYNLSKMNREKNQQRILEISNTLQKEFQGKILTANTFDVNFNEYLEGLVLKFSNVFESDINLYDTNGRLLSSSRPELFSLNITSTLMNPAAFTSLHAQNTSSIVLNENVGSLYYSSAYVPILNNQGQSIAYLNLPFFARHAELRNEISSFLMTLINVYVAFVLLAIGLVLVLTRYITRPLKMIRNTMQSVQLLGINRSIEWKGTDEIGQLVLQYNRMIDELSISAEKLAKTERESAWREMAKQVAHEIKNPLTPMKLSVQHILRAYKDGAPDMEDRLKRLSETLIQQIDTLSDIATSFADFANLPKLELEKVDCIEVIKNSVDLFKSEQLISFLINYDQDQRFFVYSDKNQLLRVFNNLIKNAVQAIGENTKGIVNIGIQKKNKTIEITVSDNGKGMSEEEQNKIFSPNFTTKSNGKGLGLIMAKNIILNSEGSIEFESKLGKGTTFYINLKLYSIDNE